MTEATVRKWRVLAGAVAVVFGIATLVEGSHVLFGTAEARAEAGNYVPFVLWFNFAAGFFYVVAGLFAVAGRPAARLIAIGIAAGSAVVLALFLVHAARGGGFERRTMVAMPLRTVFWLVQAVALRRLC